MNSGALSAIKQAKENNEGIFIPTAMVRNDERIKKRFSKRSPDFAALMGKKVVINPNTKLEFSGEGNIMRASFEVTPMIGSNITYRVATHFLVTTCKRTAEEFNITFLPKI